MCDISFGVFEGGGGEDAERLLEMMESAGLQGQQMDGGEFFLAGPGDKCPECARGLVIRELSYECPQCNLLFEAADFDDILPTSVDTEGSTAIQGRLRVVGQNSQYFQSDLDRSNPRDTVDVQRANTLKQLIQYNKAYQAAGNRAFPINVLARVADKYSTVRSVGGVRRNNVKREILASLVEDTCPEANFKTTKIQASQLLQLPTNGTAKGADYVRSIEEDSGITINSRCDELGPQIETIFAYLEDDIPEKKFPHEPLKRAIRDIILVAEEEDIGYRSQLRSKTVAVTYEVLRRRGVPVSLDTIASKNFIRKHTIKTFLEDPEDGMYAHLSAFHEVFKKHGLAKK